MRPDDVAGCGVRAGVRGVAGGRVVLRDLVGGQMTTRRIWVDFNGVTSGWVAHTLTKFADGRIRAGQEVVAYDEDGTECDATVTGVDLESVSLLIDPVSFREGS